MNRAAGASERAGAADPLERWSALHGGITVQGPARRWLVGCLAIARPLRRVPPTVLTCTALAAALGVPAVSVFGGRRLFAAAALAVLAGVLDNLDGAVAALSGRATAFGAVLDSVADRLADSALFLALWLLGAPGWLVGIVAFGTALQEYVRARAAGLGMPALPITVWERPTRVILVCGLLAGCGIFPGSAGPIATAGAAAAIVLLAVAAVQLMRPAR